MRVHKTEFKRADLGDGSLDVIVAACHAEPFEYRLRAGSRERAMGRVPERCLHKAAKFPEGSPEHAHWIAAAEAALEIYQKQRVDQMGYAACEIGKRTFGCTLIPAGQRPSIGDVRRFSR